MSYWPPLRALLRHPLLGARLLKRLPEALRGAATAREWGEARIAEKPRAGLPDNPLRAYFDANAERAGITKWAHYLDIYHRHLAKFRGAAPRVLEVGVHRGGSLGMWASYFGPECRLFGVDIDPGCLRHEDSGVTVVVGDQADRSFWRGLKSRAEPFDVVIDDGGHEPEQQIATLEELLPFLAPGGVYICEDVHGPANAFAAYVQGLAHGLNAFGWPKEGAAADPAVNWKTTSFQADIAAVHLYPYMAVIEKSERAARRLIAPQGCA